MENIRMMRKLHQIVKIPKINNYGFTGDGDYVSVPFIHFGKG